GRDNPDGQPRSITARPDAAPVITITDPHVSPLKVRPDDTLTLRFTATDDFGVDKIDALVQVDQRSPTTFPIPRAAPDAAPETRTTAEGALNPPELIAASNSLLGPGAPEPHRVTYQFKVRDNRDAANGGAQENYSARQYLDLDKTAAPIAQRLDAAAIK